MCFVSGVSATPVAMATPVTSSMKVAMVPSLLLWNHLFVPLFLQRAHSSGSEGEGEKKTKKRKKLKVEAAADTR